MRKNREIASSCLVVLFIFSLVWNSYGDGTPPPQDDGNPANQFEIGKKYYFGNGVAKNYDEAYKWYRKAADQGYAPAEDELGMMYYKGYSVAKNPVEAMKWFRKAAELGNIDGQNNLGFLYDQGEGLPHDRAEATKWYRKSAAQGNGASEENLQFLYKMPPVATMPHLSNVPHELDKIYNAPIINERGYLSRAKEVNVQVEVNPRASGDIDASEIHDDVVSILQGYGLKINPTSTAVVKVTVDLAGWTESSYEEGPGAFGVITKSKTGEYYFFISACKVELLGSAIVFHGQTPFWAKGSLFTRQLEERYVKGEGFSTKSEAQVIKESSQYIVKETVADLLKSVWKQPIKDAVKPEKKTLLSLGQLQPLKQEGRRRLLQGLSGVRFRYTSHDLTPSFITDAKASQYLQTSLENSEMFDAASHMILDTDIGVGHLNVENALTGWTTDKCYYGCYNFFLIEGDGAIVVWPDGTDYTYSWIPIFNHEVEVLPFIYPLETKDLQSVNFKVSADNFIREINLQR